MLMCYSCFFEWSSFIMLPFCLKKLSVSRKSVMLSSFLFHCFLYTVFTFLNIISLLLLQYFDRRDFLVGALVNLISYLLPWLLVGSLGLTSLTLLYCYYICRDMAKVFSSFSPFDGVVIQKLLNFWLIYVRLEFIIGMVVGVHMASPF